MNKEKLASGNLTTSGHGITGGMASLAPTGEHRGLAAWLDNQLSSLKCPSRLQLAERVVGMVSATEGFRFAMEHKVPPCFPQSKFVLVLGFGGQVRIMWTAFITDEPKPNLTLCIVWTEMSFPPTPSQCPQFGVTPMVWTFWPSLFWPANLQRGMKPGHLDCFSFRH
ncbi:unnamed protein product [Cladocopium goreaui]|uniref:Ion transport domain-containing protein n=1 Tax=Cladocopium goreaui TaxID=2562237 RepID=A0A9P1C587_9DINO|nr:unnamed protein product [Cladocopium goreaui]